ncbi:N-acetylglucosamine kinase [Virgibacillus oceani]
MNYVVGIDGGGTKTKALLADETGKVIVSTVAGPSNPNVVKEKELANVFHTLFASLKQRCDDMAENTTSLYAGISGAGNKENEKKILEILTKYFTEHTAIKVEVDAVNALYAGTYGKPGIVQISGTGSITYGKNSQGVVGRVGGWGYLFGDEGSGYDIGRQAVTAALKAYDGRGPETLLLNMLNAHFQLEDPQELIRSIYTSPTPKHKISPLTHIVFQAYKQNDSVAGEIINRTVRNLSLNIIVLHKKLFSSGEKVPIVLSGGIFQEKEIIPSLLEKELNALPLVLPKMSPAGGALIGAYLMKEKQMDEKFIKNIIHTE